MKTNLITHHLQNIEHRVVQSLQNKSGSKVLTVCLAAILVLTISAGCKKNLSPKTMSCAPTTNEASMSEAKLNSNASLRPQTLKELLQARIATAKYRNIENAFADGYADINVIMQNMGYHYMKAELSDTIFDPAKPEILVYNKNEKGQMELVAVEYAVPISLRPDAAPEGFTGDTDVWKYDTGFGLWLLHAWVWKYNPDGVFNPTNPNVHVDEAM